MTGDSRRPAPRGRIRARLRIGRVDLVAALDVLIAFIVFAADNSWLLSQKPARRDEFLLLLVAIITALPLTFRDRRPLAAWVSSAAAIAVSTVIVVPRHDISTPYIPARSWSTCCACTRSPSAAGTASRSPPPG